MDQRNEKSSYELFYKISPGYEQNLRVFGEMGVITNHANKKVRSKLENRGTTCVFVVYATNHAGDVYRMFNVTTWRISMSRDVIWLDKLYRDYFQLKEGTRTILSNSDSVDVSLRLLILLGLNNDWHAEIVDVRTVFLCGDLDEEVCMKIPCGYQEVVEWIDEKHWCLELKKSIHRLVQAAR